ncbi:MAG: hypothetical protein C0483_22855 [Pirellula sp.]|nr:hypothetical protein [Pirellula sp.]
MAGWNDDDNEPEATLPPPRMVSGKLVILIVCILGIGGAATGWLWTYNQQRMPREFWGYQAWVMLARAPVVTALQLDPEPAAAPGTPRAEWYEGLVVVPLDPADGARYVVAKLERVEKSPGLSLADQSTSLREALGFHRSFLWDSKAGELQEPVWRYGLVFADEAPPAPPAASATATATATASPSTTPSATAAPKLPPKSVTILFDADCKFVRLQDVDKTVVLHPSVGEQFQKFFATMFPAKK